VESKAQTSSSTDASVHASDPRFVSYYAEQSETQETRARFESVRDRAIALVRRARGGSEALDVVDIGCGAGTQALLWASLGHRVRALDINESLIEIARQRSSEAGLEIQFDVGSATALPYADGSCDVSLLPELLEHVQDWEKCLDEATRILRRGGVLYLSTTNVLCPHQNEFYLPGYSWYPRPLKRYYERLSVTTRPELVSYARYPAVHWFSFFQLRDFLARRGLTCFDRFDMIDVQRLSLLLRLAVGAIRKWPPFRWAGHVLTPYCVLFAVKH
jgi:2-polyprenyl-6-hydroxyphenyl methylase/3-demethylubiquinone-9 3-methyltransferase